MCRRPPPCTQSQLIPTEKQVQQCTVTDKGRQLSDLGPIKKVLYHDYPISLTFLNYTTNYSWGNFSKLSEIRFIFLQEQNAFALLCKSRNGVQIDVDYDDVEDE